MALIGRSAAPSHDLERDDPAASRRPFGVAQETLSPIGRNIRETRSGTDCDVGGGRTWT